VGLFYTDKPIFGFDIGKSSLKVMQIEQNGKKQRVTGYGVISFDRSAIENGVIIDHEQIIKAAHKLLNEEMTGSITTNRVVLSLPNDQTFNRVVALPKMGDSDLHNAVVAEIDQSIPLTLDELYFDYERTGKTSMHDHTENDDVQIVAVAKKIVDSYVGLFDALGLEIAMIESNVSAITRMVVQAEAHDVATLIVDVGAESCDLSYYDGSSIRATGTVDCSSERITDAIAEKLGVSRAQAIRIKTRYGLEVSKKQADIVAAADSEIMKLIYEIRKVIRYFTDQNKNENPVGQIIILGGGANLLGLSTYITDKTRVPTRLCAPWSQMNFGKLQPPHELETTLYTTAGGLALVSPKEIG